MYREGIMLVLTPHASLALTGEGMMLMKVLYAGTVKRGRKDLASPAHNDLPVCRAERELSPWSATPARDMAGTVQPFL